MKKYNLNFIGRWAITFLLVASLACNQKAETKPGFDEAVLASDAFFPMDDSVQYAAEHGIKAIVEPGGSIKDKDSIAKADELGIVLVFSGTRHFKH